MMLSSQKNALHLAFLYTKMLLKLGAKLVNALFSLWLVLCSSVTIESGDIFTLDVEVGSADI